MWSLLDLWSSSQVRGPKVNGQATYDPIYVYNISHNM